MHAIISTKNRGSDLRKRLWQHREVYLFILPAVLWFFVFCYLPMYGLLIAFKDYRYSRGILGSAWVGAKWFSRFLSDNTFWNAFTNTLRISITRLVLGFPAPIIMALMINSVRNRQYKRAVQTISYLPHFISWVVVAAMVYKILSPYQGLFNELRRMINPAAEPIFYMGQEHLFLPMLIITSLWKETGWNSIIYLAAITNIDPQLYEAADIDGARGYQMTWFITLPCMLPTIGVLLILSLGGILNAGFEQILLLQTSATVRVSEVLDTYVLHRGILQGNHSYSTAVGMTKSVITMALIIIVNRISRRTMEVSLW